MNELKEIWERILELAKNVDAFTSLIELQQKQIDSLQKRLTLLEREKTYREDRERQQQDYE